MPHLEGRLRLPTRRPVAPGIAVLRRIAIALALVLVNWGVVLLERDGYTDNVDGKVSGIDALYYTTVTLTTTGYGDITPVTPTARLVNALAVTPMRLLFVLVLVGTTIQVLTERSREEFRALRWRSRVRDHVVVCGYGTKGRSAIRALLQRGYSVESIVVVDLDPQAVAAATAAGHTAVQGSTTTDEVLREAIVAQAKSVVVAVSRDDTAALTVLTVRQLAPGVSVVAAIREEENADLLRQSGADSVITSSDAAGRLLGLATDSPDTVRVLEDLMAVGRGLDLLERAATPAEVGKAVEATGQPVLAVVRAGEMLPFDDPRAATIQAADRLIYVAGPRTS
jgi:voltage-gated potassium channel